MQNMEVPVLLMGFTYGIFTAKPSEFLWFFLLEILHFTMVFRWIELLKLFRLFFT